MNSKFIEKNESNDWNLLKEFNETSNYFTDLIQREKYATSDASGVTFDGRTFGIELKKRNQVIMNDGRISGQTYDGKSYTADTIFIEAHKATSMLLDYLYKGDEPLYINFLNDGWTVIYNLSKLTSIPKKKHLTIKSKGYNREEGEYRFELPLKDAVIFRNNKLYKKMGDEWYDNEPEPFC